MVRARRVRYRFMLIVGLTGGVGCGKTTVANSFKRYRIPTIDADEITRDLVVPGSPILQRIVTQFGQDILRADGHLDRRKLRQIVFNNPSKRQQLERLLHPEVRKQILRWINTQSAPYCLVVIPLLVESGMDTIVNRVLVVDCDAQTQIDRVVARDACSKEQVRAIMATQTSSEARLAKATDVIQNNDDLASLHAQVDTLHERFLQLVTKRLRK